MHKTAQLDPLHDRREETARLQFHTAGLLHMRELVMAIFRDLGVAFNIASLVADFLCRACTDL